MELIALMAKAQDKEDNIVQLRVDEPESFRSRLKALSALKGITMGELVFEVMTEPLKVLEREARKD